MRTNLQVKNVGEVLDRSILIVDDEPSIVNTLSSVLQDEGYKVLTASNGEEALQIITEQKPPVVFLDMWMPGKDGIEVLREIISLRPETQVVMISGHATITNALDAVRLGAVDFLEKPFTIDSISSSLNKALVNFDSLSRKGNNLSEEFTKALKFDPHPGSFGKVLAGNNIGQRTIKESIVLYGQCLHSGAKSGLVLEPLPKNSGIHFSHLGSNHSVPAYVSNVESTTLATTVRSQFVSASTIEHLFAALHAFKISNLLIKCNGEVPIFDGSASVFCQAIKDIGIVEQGGDWHEITLDEKIVFSNPKSGEELTLEPSDRLQVSYELIYPEPVGRQFFVYDHTDAQSFEKEIAPARTFGFLRDIEKMQRMGLAAGGRLDNFILIGEDKIINTELRFEDELCRHKILDAIGDLFLIGRPLRMKISAKMTGHADNISALRMLNDRLLRQ